jgi:hypothetical protein
VCGQDIQGSEQALTEHVERCLEANQGWSEMRGTTRASTDSHAHDPKPSAQQDVIIDLEN